MARIAIAQVQGHWRVQPPPEKRQDRNLTEFQARLAQAGDERPDLIVAGEAINRIGFTRDDPLPTENVLDGPFFSAASDAARRSECYVAYSVKGLAEGVCRNAAVLIDRRGELVGTYFKVHPTQGELDVGVVAGDAFGVFETDLGPVGMMICHDMSYPESARCLMLNGARLILWPSNWSGWGEHISYTVIASRAIDNAAWIAYASMGHDPERVDPLNGTRGRSAVFDPEGRIVCQITDRLPGVISCDIDPARQRIAPNFTQGPDDVFRECILRERRPDAYGPICRPR